MFRSFRFCVLPLMLVFSAVLFAQTDEEVQQEAMRKLQTRMDELRAQMAEIQSELNAIHGTNLPRTGSIESTPPPPSSLPQLTPEQREEAAGKATSQHQTFNEDEQDAPRLYNAPLEPEEPGFFLLPGTRTMLRLNGSIRTDFIYDPRISVLSDAFVPSSIPIPSISGPGNFIASIRGSRAMADFLIPVGEHGAARTFIQLDFVGPNGTTAPRLRHFYAQLDNILVGQTFTNFMDPDAFADTLDTQGANSGVSARVPQARYSFGLGGGASAYVSVEVPASSIGFSIAGTAATATTPAPDGTFRVRNEWERGHIQLASVFRDLGVKLPNGFHESAFGWGLNGTGGLEVHGQDNVVVGIAYGHGISRYMADTGGLDLDAAPKSTTDLSLRALPLFGAYGSYQHYWSSAVRSSATAGYVQLQNTAFQPANTYHKSTYSSLNLIWNPLGSLDLGAEFLYGRVKEKSGASANDPRFQITARYTFVKLHEKEEHAP
ncbi:MAG TPA: DcaP family trimeric outer membrane transporter [Terriglobales bacterium]|nr:DcaP family trimeric outer membrane transporter [Terriglobales bacterium]